MVVKKSDTVKTEVWHNEDETHRYLMKKTWDNKKPSIMVITLYPTSLNTLYEDMTTRLIFNQWQDKDVGSIVYVNLYSKLSATGKNKQSLFGAYDKETDEVILSQALKCEQIVFAWGSLPQMNKKVSQRVEELVERLQPLKVSTGYLTDERSESCIHPLSPKVRHQWLISDSL